MVLRLIILLFFIVSSNGGYSREDTHSPSQGLSYRISNGTSNETLNGTSNGHSQGQLQLHSIEHSQEYSSNKSANYSRKSPQQVHLSFGIEPSAIIITWVTFDSTSNTIVEYGIDKLENTVVGKYNLFEDGGSEKRKLYIHRVTLTNLKANEKYIYRCGSNDEWSKMFYFKTINDHVNWSPSLAVYGDMGAVNAKSVPMLTQDVQNSLYDAVIHVGDFAYDMDKNNARVGDEFMRLIEPIAAYVPYITCPGNHEQRYNFSNYYNRFTMVNKDTNEQNNYYFSFDLGPAHIISFSTEFYYFTKYGWHQIQHQYEWLENDLKQANKNRSQRPWIIIFGHRPLYCGNKNDYECHDFKRTFLHKGIKMHNQGLPKYSVEDLFYKYGVDLQLFGHEHDYHRLFPVYKNKVYNGTADDPYNNPGAPVTVVTGSAGCINPHGTYTPPLPEWSAFRNNKDFGYAKIFIHNKTHLELQQISVDKNGQPIDSFTIIKDKPQPSWLTENNRRG